MGQHVEETELAEDDPGAVRSRLQGSVSALRRMVESGWFDGHEDTMGLEVEMDLVDPLGRPRLVNDAVLRRLARQDLQHELAQFNIELNMPPLPLTGSVLSTVEAQLARAMAELAARSEPLGVRVLAIGTLPTLTAEQLTYERLSAIPRYALLSERIRQARRRPYRLRMEGRESLSFAADSVAPEAAATSLQLHLRVSPERFAAYYNAAQAIAAVQVAVGANSPYLLGRQLWEESRIALCEQMLDSRRAAEVARGDPPRVWLGDRWASSVLELFESLVERFPPLLPAVGPEDPHQALDEGRAPLLTELRLHNGTVWRWNRPVYDVQAGRPHLRIENRVLPSGPTAVDMTANAALFYGLVRTLALEDPPLCTTRRFDVAERDLHRAARHGLDASTHWDGRSHRLRDLLLDRLLPLARAGLASWQIDPADADRYLGVVAERVRTGRTGARWQTATVAHLEGRGLDRSAALREMTRRYGEHARLGAPVHEWPVP